MGLPTWRETHRFMEPTTVDTVGADIIRPSMSGSIRTIK